MKNTNDNLEKICNFYMSDWHFIVMLLPYINKEINMQTQIITIFEKDMTEKVKTLVEKLNLKNKEKILKINWKNSDINNFKNEFQKKFKAGSKNLLIVNGTNNYINEINKVINNMEYNDSSSSKQIKIIDCYDFDSNKDNISTILKKYDGMLNTSGETKIKNIL